MRYFLLFLALFLQLNASGYTDDNPQNNCAQTVTGEYGLSHTEGVEPVENITNRVFEEGTFVPAAKLTEKQQYSIVTNYLGTPEAMYREDGEAVWTCELNSYGRVRNFQGESKSSGLPTRLHQQVRKLRVIYGKENVEGTVVQDLGMTTTKAAKGVETARIQAHYNKTGEVPEGNTKSFKSETGCGG